MNLPKGHSRASFEILRKSEKPESATVKPPERTPIYKAGNSERYNIWMIENGMPIDNCTGRKPGSRVEWNEELEIFTIVNPKEV